MEFVGWTPAMDRFLKPNGVFDGAVTLLQNPPWIDSTGTLAHNGQNPAWHLIDYFNRNVGSRRLAAAWTRNDFATYLVETLQLQTRFLDQCFTQELSGATKPQMNPILAWSTATTIIHEEHFDFPILFSESAIRSVTTIIEFLADNPARNPLTTPGLTEGLGLLLNIGNHPTFADHFALQVPADLIACIRNNRLISEVEACE